MIVDAAGIITPPRTRPGELERATVLGHSAHDVIRRAVGDLSLNFERDAHPRADQLAQVGDHFFGNPVGVAPGAFGAQHDAAVEAARFAWTR